MSQRLYVIAALALTTTFGCRPASSPAPAPSAPPATPQSSVAPTPLPLAEPLLARLSEAATLLRANNASALSSLEALEKDATTSAVLSEQLAGLYEELDFIDRRYPLAKQAVRLDPSYAPGQVRLGRTEQYLGYFASAEKHLKEAVRLAPGSSDAHFALALLYRHLEKPKEAEACLVAARNADPAEWRFCLIQSQVQTTMGKFDEALRSLADAKGPTVNPDALQLQRALVLAEQASSLEKKGETTQAANLRKEALPLAESAVSKLPEDGPSWFHVGKLRKSLGDSKGALKALEKAYLLAPGFQNTRYQLGQLLIQVGEPERAKKLLAEEAAIKQKNETYQRLTLRTAQSPDDLEKRRQLAQYCVSRLFIHRAIFEWEQILERKPEDREAKQAIASLKAKRLKDMTQ